MTHQQTPAENRATFTPVAHPWIILITVMLVSMLELLDTTVVNVSLRNMMTSLNADQNQITWVITAYLTASAIMLPLTGFLINRVGQKNLLMINILGFMLASSLCGLSTNLSEMVLFRIFQGIFGSSLISLSQITIRQVFPEKQQAKVMPIWALGVVIAPALGPTVGGFITQYMDWRFIFYVNIPICLIGFLLTLRFIPRPPRRPHVIHWTSLILMVIGIASLQLFLDQGSEHQWFQSNAMLLLFVVATICILAFIAACFMTKNPLVDLRLYKEKNFATACILIACSLGTLSAITALEPLMLESIFQYPTLMTGKMMGALAIGVALSTLILSRLMRYLGSKLVACIGLLVATYGLYRLTHITLHTDADFFLLNNMLLGIGLGFVMTPVNISSLKNLPLSKIPSAAGLYTYGRMLGSSIGVSLSNSAVISATQRHWHLLTQYLNPFSARLHFWFSHQHARWLNTSSLAGLQGELQRHATLMGFLSGFQTLALVFLLLIPFVFLLDRQTVKDTGPQ